MAVWEELLFGNGFWLGLLLIEVMLFVIAILNRFGSYFSAMFSLIMFIVYYQELPSTNNFKTYGMIIMIISALIFFLIGKE